MLWRKEREQHPRGLGQQLLSLPLHVHPYQRPPLNPKMMYQIADPYLQFPFIRALHGLVQARYQATYLKKKTGCSHQTIWTMATKIKLRMNLKSQPVSQDLSPQLNKRNPKQMSSPQKNAVRDQVALFTNLRRRRRNKTRHNSRRCHPIQSYKRCRSEDRKNLDLNMTKVKQ